MGFKHTNDILMLPFLSSLGEVGLLFVYFPWGGVGGIKEKSLGLILKGGGVAVPMGDNSTF